MKKKIIAVLIMICVLSALLPTISRAAVTPYFMAINDTLLDFDDDTIPYIVGNEIFVSVKVFQITIPGGGGVSVYALADVQEEQVLLYRGVVKMAVFSTKPDNAVTKDQDGNILNWPSARRIESRFYVPLAKVCEYFGLTYEVHDIRRDIIPDEQMKLIRIVSDAKFNTPTFEGLNRNAIRAAYDRYNAPPEQPSPTVPGTTEPPIVEPPPGYSDVTIHLSFFDISAGNAESILDLLDTQSAFGYSACFFVNAEDILADPGLIRRISGSGHSIGINLTENTYAEYLETSGLLFEAAKIKTILVCADTTARGDTVAEGAGRWVLWDNSADPDFYDTVTVDAITNTIPKERNARSNLMLSCSENAANLLPGIISFLRVNEYTIEMITETVEPID